MFSTSVIAVQVRFFFFIVQFVIAAYWVFALFLSAAV
jgi:hypothetical protein